MNVNVFLTTFTGVLYISSFQEFLSNYLFFDFCLLALILCFSYKAPNIFFFRGITNC